MKETHLNNHENLKNFENNEKYSGLRNHENVNESEYTKNKQELIDKSRKEAMGSYSENKQDVQKKIRENIDDKELSSDKSIPTNSYLKGVTLSNELRHIRKNLSPLDKFGSNLIHQKGINKASEIGSNTIFRASGLLGGGFLAFIGTFVYYYYAKHDGLTYNYLLAIIFFVAGFFLGLIIELFIKLFRSNK